MKIMGLDYGSKTVGVAISDDLLFSAHPVETICRDSEKKLRKTLSRIEELVREHQVQKVVLGLPLLPDGSEGERVEKTKAFQTLLAKKINLEIILVDERYTTDASKEELLAMGVKSKDLKKSIDQLAACMILEAYLNSPEGEALRKNISQ